MVTRRHPVICSRFSTVSGSSVGQRFEGLSSQWFALVLQWMNLQTFPPKVDTATTKNDVTEDSGQNFPGGVADATLANIVSG